MTRPHQDSGDQKSILVVDDAPENLRLLLTSLTDQGYSVRCAKSGNLALAGSQNLPPDLILLDILMPQMDGFEVCEQLRKNVHTRDVPVIFLSALDGGDSKVRAFELGGNDYVSKPFNIDELLARIKYQLESNHRQRWLQQSAMQYQQQSQVWQAAHALLQDVLNSLQEGVLALAAVRDEQGSVVDFTGQFVNDAFLRLMGRTDDRRTVEATTLRSLMQPQPDCELFERCVEVLQTNETIRAELLPNCGTQSDRLELYATKLRDGVVACLRNIEDVSQQIATLEAVKQELYTLATTDSLTQIANRYCFDSYLAAEWARSQREQQPLSLLLGDIDRFKRYNDLCGHAVGDRCLQAVAQALQLTLKRPADLVARYGGEEFVILLPNTPLEGAIRVADQAQSAIRALHLPHTPHPECEHIRLSIGIACTIPELTDGPQQLIEAADQALYQAKNQGGDTNCVGRV